MGDTEEFVLIASISQDDVAKIRDGRFVRMRLYPDESEAPDAEMSAILTLCETEDVNTALATAEIYAEAQKTGQMVRVSVRALDERFFETLTTRGFHIGSEDFQDDPAWSGLTTLVIMLADTREEYAQRLLEFRQYVADGRIKRLEDERARASEHGALEK